MKKVVTNFLILALFSLNSHAGPLSLGPGDGARPDIRPGDRGSIAQQAMGLNQNHYSPLNPGSNQASFLRNNFLLQQQLANNSYLETYTTFNPEINPAGPATILPIDSVNKQSGELTGGSSLLNRVASSPFISRVAKSQTQGAVFVNSANSFTKTKDAATSESYLAGPAFAAGAIIKFKEHKDNPTQVPIGTPIGLLFVAAALLFLPSILSITGSTMFGNPSGSTSEASGVIYTSDISAQMVDGGVPTQEAQKISQALISMWTIAISAGLKDVPANTRNEISSYFTDSCAACTPQMIDAVMTKSEQLVISNPALRLDQAQLKGVAAKINSAVKSSDQANQEVSGGEGGKQIFIKTLQGKTITL